MREPTQGEGRGELLPLGEILKCCGYKEIQFVDEVKNTKDSSQDYFGAIITYIHKYKKTLKEEYLYAALSKFCQTLGWSPSDMFLEVAKQSEAGAIKYADNNYAHGDGIPVSNYIGHAIIHLLKYKSGRTDEPHDRAFCWNIVTCLWTLHNLKQNNDLAKETLEKYETYEY